MTSSFLRQSTSQPGSAAAYSPLMAHDPPLMPLFTPVLQDFQNRYGSSSLLQHSQDHPDGHDHDHNDHSQEDYRIRDRAPNFHDHVAAQEGDDEDEDENEEEDDVHDQQISSRRNILFGRIGGGGQSD
ncbi:hypothetical protein BGX28_001552, partial [Mortierella sp. GBA30]